MIPRTYAPVVCCPAETNTTGLGCTERRIINYLRTGPGGFGGGRLYSGASGELLEHDEPDGVTIADITQHVYSSKSPTPAQTRTVQRATARLADIGLVIRWHSFTGFRDKPHKTPNGFETHMPVPALFVALADWRCPHIERRDEQQRQYAELEQQRREAEEAERRRLFDDPITALQHLFGNK
jgi:hypothetical protein